MSRKIFDNVVEANKFRNYDTYVNAQSNPMYMGEVSRKYKPIVMEDALKGSEPMSLVDIFMKATTFNQAGEKFIVIGDKEYSLSKLDFKEFKALVVGQLNSVQDVSRAVADGILYYNGEEQTPTGSMLYNHIFNVTKERVGELLGLQKGESGNTFADAIEKMNG